VTSTAGAIWINCFDHGDVAAGAGKAVHVALLAAPGQEFELECLAPLHTLHTILVDEREQRFLPR
jgi:hypothetical protein